MDYAKLKADLLEIFTRKSYVLTTDRENLANQIVDLIKKQVEPQVDLDAP